MHLSDGKAGKVPPIPPGRAQEEDVVLETTMSSWDIVKSTKLTEGKYVEYKVICLRWDFTNSNLDEWSVHKRYSQFEELHKELQSLLPHDIRFPKKTGWFDGVSGKKFGEPHLVERCSLLQEYVKQIAGVEQARNSKNFIHFFDLDFVPGSRDEARKWVVKLEKNQFNSIVHLYNDPQMSMETSGPYEYSPAPAPSPAVLDEEVEQADTGESR